MSLNGTFLRFPYQRSRTMSQTRSQKAVLALALVVVRSLFGQAASCPNPPVPTITSSQVPSDVCVPDAFQGNPIAFFDDYSWKIFIGLAWPAQAAHRGVADTGQTITGSGP